MAQPGIVEGRLVGEQGEVADLQCRTAAHLQASSCSLALQGGLLVDFEAGREQHIHLAALQGAVEGGGITERHQVDTAIGGFGPPIPRKRL